ncbi:PAS domain S-box protein [Salinibacillus xinjiangensis]|uniref:HTH-type transcriptional regulatory protein TyrR n=2 Tax=Salinibacillus xinjiangensis TaxID=1229268 RepID=A0A6G1X4Z7_9BACI|nr:PAS domain S-box protein [Salinibacillus xinjiangensis]
MIILDQNHVILFYNHLLEESIEAPLSIGGHIKDSFYTWEYNSESNVVTAECGNKIFIFLQHQSNDHNQSILIGTETPELSSLKLENKELKRLNRELDAIIENSYDGIYITDHHGKTLKTNTAIERITGIPKEYYLGKNVDELISRGILKKSVTNEVLKQQKRVSYIQKNFAGNETILTGTPVFNEKGKIEKIVTNIRDLSDLNELQSELSKVNQLNVKYKKEIDRLKNKPDQVNGMITKSEQMKMIYDTADTIADVDATVLILGETGVGKDVLAKYIFKNSSRSKDGDFVKVNCGAIPPDLLESELFGYESGAFTGASRKGKTGLFEVAHNGILFLDEIGELPLGLQVKLLRVLQEGEIQRIGGTKPKKVNVRIIAATNKRLKEMVQKGEFREDLYYRLHVIPIHIPPLRKRRDDILPLMDLFITEFNHKYQLEKELDFDVKEFFLSYDWPGNIRELANLIERMVVTTRSDVITMENLPSEYQSTQESSLNSIVPLKEAVEIAEKSVLSLALQEYDNTYDIAKALGTSQPTVVRKLRKYNLKLK